ncbi:MAG: hypothetical protein K2K96_00055 [Lachnospiraceae bacterium]|nr:hypothetical protein [Lachnospiraceae bacterium]
MAAVGQQKNNLQIHKSYNGELNVYFALMIAVIIPLILTMIEGSRINAMKLQLECVVDMGMDSVLAEYNRPLLEQYDLLFIDLAYEQPAGSLDHLKEHFAEYISYNLQPWKELPILQNRDFLGLDMETVDILAASRATDEQGAVFRYMAISYMLNKYGMDYVDDLQDMIAVTEREGLYDSNIMAENDNAQNAIDSIEIPPPEDLEEGEEWNEPEKDDPTDSLNELRYLGILPLVCEGEISTASINPGSYVTGRSLVTGSGMEESWQEHTPLVEGLLFNEFIMEKCGNYSHRKEGSPLCYETEYVIAGKSNDADNLRIVAERLLLIRGGANSIYFLGNQELKAEAKALAASLSFVLLYPEFEMLFEVAIIAAWIYAESVVDVRQLFSGNRVPLIKGEGEWNLSLENALGLTVETVSDMAGDGDFSDNEGESGLSYEDYLRLLLYITPLEEKTGRCMNLVEMNIREVAGYENFCLDQCVAALTFQMVFSSSYGYSFLMQRSCRYT